MGTDVHAIAQVQEDDGTWRDVFFSWQQQRNYFLFGWLAGVRNGYGFAGVPIYESHKAPIAPQRGLPHDFEFIDEGEGSYAHPAPYEAIRGYFMRDWKFENGEYIDLDEPVCSLTREEWEREYNERGGQFGYGGRFWMGYHDHTWVTAKEVLEREVPVQHHIGYVPRDTYIEWRQSGDDDPKTWSGGVGDPQNSVTESQCINGLPPADCSYVRCNWESTDHGVERFRKCVQELVDEYPGREIRIVMGFDS